MRIIRNNDEKGNNLDKHFKEIRNLETEPSANLWDKLEDRLDEDRERVKHDHWYKAMLLLLIPFTVINLLVTYDLTDKYKSGSQDAGNSLPQLSQSSGIAIPNSLDNAGNWGCFLNGSFLPPFHSASNDNTANRAAHQVPVLFANASGDNASFAASFIEPYAASLPANNASAIDRQLAETSATPADVMNYHSRKMKDKSIASVKGFHLGIEGGVINNWVVYNETSGHSQFGTTQEHTVDLSPAYGISAGYDFSRHCGIAAEFIFKTKQVQEYWELRYGKLLRTGKVQLEYMHFPIMFKYKWTRVPGRLQQPHVVNLIAGLQYSRLRNATVIENNLDLEKLSELYNRNELGLIMGLEYDIFVHRNYYLSFGARAGISTDAGSFPMFRSAKTDTYNMMVGANMSFNFLASRNPKH